MKIISLATLLLVAVLGEAQADEPSPAELLNKLQQGGYVVYVRHAATDHTQRDLDHRHLEDCTTQRNLSALGRRQAQAIGAGFKRHHIPVGAVLSSPWCRARETANLSFGRAELVDELGFSLAESRDETRRRSKALRKLLATTPPEGTNTLLVSHTSNLKEAAGFWPKPEGVLVVFRPEPGAEPGYRYIGMIQPRSWLEGEPGP